MVYLIIVLMLLEAFTIGFIGFLLYMVYTIKKEVLDTRKEVLDTKEFFRKRDFLTSKSIEKLASIDKKTSFMESVFKNNDINVDNN